MRERKERETLKGKRSERGNVKKEEGREGSQEGRRNEGGRGEEQRGGIKKVNGGRKRKSRREEGGKGREKERWKISSLLMASLPIVKFSAFPSAHPS